MFGFLYLMFFISVFYAPGVSCLAFSHYNMILICLSFSSKAAICFPSMAVSWLFFPQSFKPELWENTARNHMTCKLTSVWAKLWKMSVVNSQPATWLQMYIHGSFKIQIRTSYNVPNLENKIIHQKNSDKFETLKMCWWNTVKRVLQLYRSKNQIQNNVCIDLKFFSLSKHYVSL